MLSVNKQIRVPELLAPAGDFEKLKTVIHYGADAVYLGDSRFSLRGKAGNFSGEELKAAVDYAHEHGRKAYVTLNIFPHNKDLPVIEGHIEFLKDVKPDGVILSDIGVFSMLKKKAPEIDIHISTQANITNSKSAEYWESEGAKRLVLSRELTIDEIRQIRDNVSLELEVFVHGSICISYSGRCYISSFLASRGANKGECTNSCRWNYTLMEEKREGEHMPVFEDDRGTYLMSSKDLCMIEHLPLLADAGIDSFKIEGRMKGINYAAGVTKVYREAIDAIKNRKFNADKKAISRWLREIAMFSSRGYTTGMFFGSQPDDGYNSDGESYRMSHELVGVVLDVNGASAKIALRNRLNEGDEIEYLLSAPDASELNEKTFIVEAMSDEDGLSVISARNEDIVFMTVPQGVRRNDLIRRKKEFKGNSPS